MNQGATAVSTFNYGWDTLSQMIPREIAAHSIPGGKFDIKTSGAFVGRLLNGKYATTRSAGSYLAGLNAASVGVPATDTRGAAGALHHKGLIGLGLNIMFGITYGQEIPYAARRIEAGIQAGRRIYQADLVRRMQRRR